MKMKEIVMNPRMWKTDYLNLNTKIAKQREEYCRLQVLSGRKDTYNIYEESRRLFK